MGKICKALSFASDASDESILNTCVQTWADRNLNADGSLKPNSYAPIYLTRGDGESAEKLLVRRVQDNLTLYHGGKSIPLPTATTTYVMPTPLALPTPATPKPPRKPRSPSKSRGTRKNAKK